MGATLFAKNLIRLLKFDLKAHHKAIKNMQITNICWIISNMKSVTRPNLCVCLKFSDRKKVLQNHSR